MDKWIVLDFKPVRHASYEKACEEKRRLAAKHPEKSFHVLRVKTHPWAGQLYRAFLEFAERLATASDLSETSMRRFRDEAAELVSRDKAREKEAAHVTAKADAA